MKYPGEQDVNVIEAIDPKTSSFLLPTSSFDRKPLLSILTPAVPSRIRQLDWLCTKIERQIGDLAVEHLVLIDNKRRTVGEKRDALLRVARGDYVAFVDDDDDIADDYVDEITYAIATAKTAPDVITFLQKATVNGQTGIIEFKLGNPNEPFISAKDNEYPAGSALDIMNGIFPRVKRNAWHICAWRRELAIGSHFPPINYGEDWQFAEPLCAIAETSVHIDKVLHYYRHSSATTEAPPPGVSILNDAFHAATGR